MLWLMYFLCSYFKDDSEISSSHSSIWHSKLLPSLDRVLLPQIYLLRIPRKEPRFTVDRRDLKGCGMGPWLVLVSSCFRENVVATCKIGSFLCSLDNLLQKNVIVLFFGNQISKWRSFEKRAIFDLLFTFFSHQGKVTKIPSAHISLTYIHVFCSPYWFFLP